MRHIFKYRLICFLKNKSILFWSLAFPIALSTLFFFAFGNFERVEQLETMKVAVVEQGNEAFSSFIKEVSDPKGETYFIDPVYVNEKEAKKLVEEKEVVAAIVVSEKPSLFYSKISLNVKILEGMIQDYERIHSTIQTIGKENPTVLNEQAVQNIISSNVEINALKTGGGSMDVTVVYYYSALAMAILLSALFGVRSMKDSQANASAKAIRLNVAPTHKLKVIVVDYILSFLIMTAELSIIFAYMIFVLNVDFGKHFLLTYFVSLCGVLMSLGYGILIGSLSKLSENTTMNIIGNMTIASCFLAGMMVGNMPYIIDKYVPFIKYINPATLISNSFSILYYYEDISNVYVNIAIILGFSIGLLAISYRTLGRKAYASV